MSAEARVARDAITLIVGRVLTTIAEAVLPLAVVRLVGKAEVGELAALFLVYQTIGLVATAGFPDALMYHIPSRPPAERRAVAYATARVLFALGALGSLVLAGVGVVEALRGRARDPWLWFAFAPYALGEVPGRMLVNLLTAEGRAVQAAAIAGAQALTLTTAVLLPLAWGASLRATALSAGLAGLAQGAVVLVVLAYVYRGRPVVPSPVGPWALARFAVPLGATDIVALLNNQLDRYLVLTWFSAAVFAEYQAGAWQIPIVGGIPYLAVTAAMPELVRRFQAGRPAEAVALWSATIPRTALIVVPTAVVFFVAATDAMALLFTPAYAAGATPVFRCYTLLTLGRVAAFGAVLVAAGAPRAVLAAAAAALGFNVLFSLPLMALLGPVGAAWGTVAAFVPMVLVYLRAIGRATGLPWRDLFPLRRWGALTAAGAAAGVAAFGARIGLTAAWGEIGPAAGLLLTAGIVVPLFALIVLRAGLVSPEDRRFVLARFGFA